MNKQLPTISSENDLKAYQNYIDSQHTGGENSSCKISKDVSVISPAMSRKNTVLSNTDFMPSFLSKYIGKLVRAEFLIGDRLETKIGWILKVGADFIELKLCHGSASVVCDLHCLKFVTVAHDNDLNRLNV